ncbi:MAG: FIG097052: Sugar transporter [uncultured Sulfurovum sp.]|uniref:FIG097052: Sugar transporter n=1 Tax=uncultured Sulfurovum sp. TaxID=269237 RepID=A0A6S6TZF2_9BACT|nr:MAG: FIG097052: Sugar transporter [uncultured Sulfurovum sp.]
MKHDRLKKSTLFSYATTAIPLAMLGLPLYIYLPTFYAQNVGLSVTMVGLVLFLSRLTDVITDPLVGLYNDRFESKYGKRKPFMLFGSLVLLISFYALIHPSKEYVEFWLLGFSMLVYLGWSIVSIPYLAWSAEITSDYHEKTRLSGAREIFTILGAMSALIIPYLYGVSEDANESLGLLYMAFLITIFLMLPLTMFGVKESTVKKSNPVGFKELKALWQRVPSLRRLQTAFMLNSLANALPATLFLFYVQLVLQEESQTGPLLLLYFFSGIIGLPFWTMLAKKIGKRKSWLASMVLASLAFVFVPFLSSGDLLWFAIITFISGLSLGADMALPSSIQADVVQKVQSQKNAYAGLLFGIWAMLTKFALALAVGIGFLILGAVGFEPETPTALALTTLSLLYGGAPVVFKMFAFWIMRGYNEKQ